MTPRSPGDSGDDASPQPEARQLRAFVFGPEGPFPQARLLHRVIGFALDVTLIGALAMLILTRWILPQTYPAELAEFRAWYAEYTRDLASGEREAVPGDLNADEWSEPVWRMLVFAQNFILVFFWIYFAGAEVFYQGRTVGKRAFRLKVMDFQRVRPLDLMPAMVRSLVKTLCLFTFFPFFLLSYLAAWLLPFRRTGHDVLSRSIVVEDNPSPEERAGDAS